MTPAEIVEFARQRVRAHQRRYLRLQDADVDDLVQDVSIELLSYARRFDPKLGFKLITFLDRRANGAIVDWLRLHTGIRRKHKVAFEALRESMDTADGPMSHAMRDEDQARLRAALTRLSPSQQAFVTERLSGEKMLDIGKRNRCTQTNVSCQLRVATQKLQTLLTEATV